MNSRVLDARTLFCAFTAAILAGSLRADPGDPPEKSVPKRTGLGLQFWKTSPQFPGDFIRERWDESYGITSVSHGGGLWAVVMSKQSGYGSQFWQTSRRFPDAFVNEKWNDGHRITSIAYGGGHWAVVVSKGSGFTDQHWRTSTRFPDTIIKEFWDAGYHITALAHGGGVWGVVMSKNSGFKSQAWKTSKTFPQDFIEQHWEDGRDITSIAYGGGLWAVVMSKREGPDPTPRGYLGAAVVDGDNGALVETVIDDSPAAKAGVQNGDVIVEIDGEPTPTANEMIAKAKASTPGQTVPVKIIREGKTIELQAAMGSRIEMIDARYETQEWRMRSYFPRDFIDEYWDEGHFVTNVGYGNGSWVVVMSKEQLPKLSETPKLPKAFFSELEPD